MGILDALFNPSKNTNRGYNQAQAWATQNSATTSPFLKDLVNSGTQGNSYLSDLLGYGPNSQSVLQGLMNNPGYQAQLQQGRDAIDASAASRGMLNSGDTLKALDDYGQNSYFNFRQNEINNARNQVGLGLNGVNGLNNNVSQLSQLAIGRGQSQDAGNAAAFGNLVGLGTTIGGYLTGMPGSGGTGRITG